MVWLRKQGWKAMAKASWSCCVSAKCVGPGPRKMMDLQIWQVAVVCSVDSVMAAWKIEVRSAGVWATGLGGGGAGLVQPCGTWAENLGGLVRFVAMGFYSSRLRRG